MPIQWTYNHIIWHMQALVDSHLYVALKSHKRVPSTITELLSMDSEGRLVTYNGRIPTGIKDISNDIIKRRIERVLNRIESTNI